MLSKSQTNFSFIHLLYKKILLSKYKLISDSAKNIILKFEKKIRRYYIILIDDKKKYN